VDGDGPAFEQPLRRVSSQSSGRTPPSRFRLIDAVHCGASQQGARFLNSARLTRRRSWAVDQRNGSSGL